MSPALVWERRPFPLSAFRFPLLRRFRFPLFPKQGFTLIEIMVVVALLSVIILGLVAMFSQTQRAFRAGMAQTDVLEGGRMATEMIARELEQVVPAYTAPYNLGAGLKFGGTNFYAYSVNQFAQTLPASAASRTNLMYDLFFLTHENQRWTGIGYFIIADGTVVAGGPVPVGTLYRFETNRSEGAFADDPGALFSGFEIARRGGATPTVSKILEGVVHFSVRTYDVNGYWIHPTNGIAAPEIGRIELQTDWSPFFLNQVDCHFVSNAVPAFVEFELGILEPRQFQQYQSLPIYDAQTNFMAKQAGRVHLFRQRVAVRNVDRSAY